MLNRFFCFFTRINQGLFGLTLINMLLLVLSIITTTTSTWADTACNGTTQNPCIVQETYNNDTDIKNWRTAKLMHENYKGNISGLKHLWVSASAAPSENDFKKIAYEIKTITKSKFKKMIDVDLRQESHAYLNQQSINLTTQYNWINLGKTYQQILHDENEWIQNLASKNYVYNVLNVSQFKSKDYSNGMNVKIHALEDEQVIAEKYGFEYLRLPISDHMRPTDEVVDQFVNFVNTLSADIWLHLHCRGGHGRATTVFAMLDMLKNADKVSFNDIIKRQKSVSPYYDLFHIKKNPDLKDYSKARLAFLNHFYQYASASLQGYQGKWSDWIKENRQPV